MRKNDVVTTPKGEAVIVKFVILKGFRYGAQLKVVETGEVFNSPRTVIEKWQNEAKANESV